MTDRHDCGPVSDGMVIILSFWLDPSLMEDESLGLGFSALALGSASHSPPHKPVIIWAGMPSPAAVVLQSLMPAS